MQIQTALLPDFIENIFGSDLDPRIQRGDMSNEDITEQKRTQLMMNLREISFYNMEVLKDM